MKKYTPKEYSDKTLKGPLLIFNKSADDINAETGRRLTKGKTMEETLSIPNEYIYAMDCLPEWEWVFQSNDSICRFAKLNPQFTYPQRNAYGKYPPLPKNLDGSVLNDTFLLKNYVEDLAGLEINTTKELEELIGGNDEWSE